MENEVTVQEIDWNHVFELDCSYTVDGMAGGRFCDWLADKIARDTCSRVKHNGKIIADYRRSEVLNGK